MVSFKRANQGGAIGTFIIIAVVLTAAVVGTAYFVKQRGDQVRQQEAVATANNDAKKEAAKANDEATSVNESEKGGATDTAPVPAPSTPSTTTNEVATLPTTGPESIIAQLIAIVLLFGAGTVYVASRRTSDRSL